jgi:hypothetical protein
MREVSPNKKINVRVIRNGRPEPREDGWIGSPEERIEAVWTLTKLCLAWSQNSDGEPRLQRTVAHLQRAGRGYRGEEDGANE